MSRFTLRELLLVVLVVGFGLGWWLDRSRLEKAVKIWRLRATESASLLRDDGWKIAWRANGMEFDGRGQKGQVGFRFRMPEEWK